MVIELAGIPIEIHPEGDYLKSMCKPFLTEKPAQATVEDALLERCIELVSDETSYKRKEVCEAFAALEAFHQTLLPYDCMFFHAMLVELNGALYAFSGPSGAGKSTQGALWRDELGATIVNGDKPFLRLDNGIWYGASSPWKGKEHLGEAGHYAPLRAICFVEQAGENSIRRLDADEAAVRLLRQTRIPFDPALVQMLFDLVERLAKQVPTYVLECTDAPEAAQFAYREMA